MTRRFVLPIVALMFAVTGPLAAQQLADEQHRRAAIQYFRNGQEFMAAEKFDRAADEFTKAIEQDPLLTIAHYQLGQAYMGLQRYASAIRAYNECIEASRALFALGQQNQFAVEKARDDEIKELREVTTRGLGTSPRNARAEQRLRELEQERTQVGGNFRPSAQVLLALGSAYFRNGDRDSAVAEWRAAIEINPNLGEAHNNLAVIYMMSGKKAEAEAEVKAAEKAGFRVNPQLKADIKKIGS